MEYLILLALLGIVVVQQFHIHKLLNKLMSRNYHEYIQSEVAAKRAEQGPDGMQEDLGVPDDLRTLQGFGL